MIALELASPAFDDGADLPERFHHDADNVAPPLTWSGVPRHTVELVVLCVDDLVPGTPFVHWLVTGIHPSATGIPEGVGVPAGARSGRNGYGHEGWGGPSPSRPGGRRCVFTLHAAAAALDVGPVPELAEVRRALAPLEAARGRLLAGTGRVS